MTGAAKFFDHLADAIGAPPVEPPTFVGDDEMPSAFAATDIAAASVAAAAVSAQRLNHAHGATATDPVTVDRRLASQWFATTIDPKGWELPSLWDAIAGNYRARSGRFVRLHTNAPRHREAALGVLGCEPDRDAVQAAVGNWDAFELHEAVVAAGGVAAALRTREEWLGTEPGMAIAAEPLVLRERTPAAAAPERTGTVGRPLDGVRVLDLTRVLAGPVATRFLAGLGADVLRIDPLDWAEPGVVPEVNLGKRCARLDLRAGPDRETFAELMHTADIFVHGYRVGALEGLGFGHAWRQQANPTVVDVSLNAWGHSGPWSGRRGFDSIVQVAAGIAATGMEVFGSEIPKPLPMQALDHAAGHVVASCALRGWEQRVATGHGSRWRTSLAGIGELLCSGPAGNPGASFGGVGARDYETTEEITSWGPARRLRPPATIPGAALSWSTGATDHGTGLPRWEN